MGFDHVTDEENHHAGVDFILHGPRERLRRGDVEVEERVLTGNEEDDEDEFEGTQRLSDHLAKGRRREVDALDLQPWVAILREHK